MAFDGVHKANIQCGRGDKKGVFTGLNMKSALYIEENDEKFMVLP
jgi:hypothetical protein